MWLHLKANVWKLTKGTPHGHKLRERERTETKTESESETETESIADAVAEGAAAAAGKVAASLLRNGVGGAGVGIVR